MKKIKLKKLIFQLASSVEYGMGLELLAADDNGKEIENLQYPLATIISTAMMLRYSLAEVEQADRVEQAVQKVLASGLRTADIVSEGMTRVSTSEMGDAVVAAL